MTLKNWDTNDDFCLKKIDVQKIVFKSNFTELVIFENISIVKLILTEITVRNDSGNYEIEFKTQFMWKL